MLILFFIPVVDLDTRNGVKLSVNFITTEGSAKKVYTYYAWGNNERLIEAIIDDVNNLNENK